MKVHNIHCTLLRNHRLFEPLSDEELSTLLQGAKLVSLSRGQQLFHQDSKAERFFFIINGQIKLTRSIRDGSEKIIDIIDRENIFAEAIAFKAISNYPVGAQAIESTELLAFRNEDFRQIIKNNSTLALMLLGEMSARMHGLIKEIEVLSLKNSTLRVASYFSSLIEDHVDDDIVELPVTKRLIASQLAIQPETLSRIFQKLREQGLIDIQGSSITVLNREGLKMFV